jgi:hypothetical protein
MFPAPHGQRLAALEPAQAGRPLNSVHCSIRGILGLHMS